MHMHCARSLRSLARGGSAPSRPPPGIELRKQQRISTQECMRHAQYLSVATLMLLRGTSLATILDMV
jgi:hypothetical protein